MALRTQQIIANESGAADTADPLAGSYYIESLTKDIEKRAFEYIDKIDAMGGMLNAIENGYVQKQIQDAAYNAQIAIEKQETIVVGMNKFQIEEKSPENLLRINAEVEKTQKDSLKKLKDSRDKELVKNSLEELAEKSKTDENLIPHIIKAVKCYATIGEICNALREVHGEYKENVVL